MFPYKFPLTVSGGKSSQRRRCGLPGLLDLPVSGAACLLRGPAVQGYARGPQSAALGAGTTSVPTPFLMDFL